LGEIDCEIRLVQPSQQSALLKVPEHFWCWAATGKGPEASPVRREEVIEHRRLRRNGYARTLERFQEWAWQEAFVELLTARRRTSAHVSESG
jgi:hypothetical protein